MVFENTEHCPKCGGELRYYDRVLRISRTKRGNSSWIFLRRLRCISCQSVHREISDNVFPYKQYEAEVIIGVLDGIITENILGFEDYPCKGSMNQWRAQNSQRLLRRGG